MIPVDGLTNETVQEPKLFETTWRFEWQTAPLSLNYRLHRMAEANIVKELRSNMHALARRVPDLGRCEVRLTWFVKSTRRRDEENIVPVLKALCDGLIDAEVVTDDTPAYMVKHMPRIVLAAKNDVAHFEFRLKEIP